jgi:protein SCO1/2
MINKQKNLSFRAIAGNQRRTAFCLLLTACCFLPAVVNGQRPPGPSSPLYGARPEAGNVSTGLPAALRDVGIEQKLDHQLPLDLVFRDETGQSVKLGQYFGQKPVVLAFVYYDCPMLCTQVMNGMLESFRVLPFQMGKDYDVVTISFDPRETPQLAESKKKVYVGYLPSKMRPDVNAGWHFLTGDPDNIKQITEAVGFKYHYAARDLRLGLIESAQNKIGTPVDQLLLYCYHYDPATGKYGAAVMNIVRAGGVLTIVAILGMFLLLRRRNPAQLKLKTGGAAS